MTDISCLFRVWLAYSLQLCYWLSWSVLFTCSFQALRVLTSLCMCAPRHERAALQSLSKHACESLSALHAILPGSTQPSFTLSFARTKSQTTEPPLLCNVINSCTILTCRLELLQMESLCTFTQNPPCFRASRLPTTILPARLSAACN